MLRFSGGVYEKEDSEILAFWFLLTHFFMEYSSLFLPRRDWIYFSSNSTWYNGLLVFEVYFKSFVDQSLIQEF